MAPRLKEKYEKEIRSKIMEHFSIDNVFASPALTKIVVNMGCKGAVENKGRIDAAVRDLSTITGQRPTVRKARKSVASFKIRDGWPIGCKVTLRRERMYEFVDRLVNNSWIRRFFHFLLFTSVVYDRKLIDRPIVELNKYNC